MEKKDYEVLITRDIDSTESATVRVRAPDKQGAYEQAYDLAVNGEVAWETNDTYHGRNEPYSGAGIDDDVTEVTKPVTPTLDLFIERKVTITAQMVADWVTTAYEGGIQYWATTQAYLDKALFAELEADDLSSYPVYARPEYWERGGESELYDAETGKVFIDGVVSMASIAQAFHKLPEYRVKNLLDDGQYDAEDADVLIQTAVLGEVVFG